MNKLKKIMVGAVAGISAVSSLIFAQPAMAAYTCPSGSINAGKSVTNPAECNVEGDDNELVSTVQQIINVILSVLGIVAVIVIILGGFTYMTSSGDAAKTTKAKNTIIYGVVGLVIALLAFAIVNFVLKEVFNPSPSTPGNSTTNTSSTSSTTK